MAKRVSITTIDNPFDPFDDFTSWFDYDIEKGYYTCSKLARISETFDDMTQKEETEAIEEAIDKLISIDPFDLYRKVVREEKDIEPLENDIGEGS